MSAEQRPSAASRQASAAEQQDARRAGRRSAGIPPDPTQPLTVGDAWRALGGWLRRLAGASSIAAARAILRRPATAGMLLGEGLVALALALFLYWFGGDAAFVFSSSTFGVAALTVFGTAVMAHAVFAPAVYLPLQQRYTRGAVVRGLMLARGAVACAFCLLAIAGALLFHRVSDPTPGWIAAGTLGLVANCVVVAALTVTLTPPVMTRDERLIFLAALDVALYSLTSDDALARALWPAHLPLLPLATFYGFGATGQIGWSGLLALLVGMGYVAGLAWLADRLLARCVYENASEPEPPADE